MRNTVVEIKCLYLTIVRSMIYFKEHMLIQAETILLLDGTSKSQSSHCQQPSSEILKNSILSDESLYECTSQPIPYYRKFKEDTAKTDIIASLYGIVLVAETITIQFC